MNRILYVQYTNPAGYPPLQHSSRILAQAGCEVLFLGTGAAGADGLEFPPHPLINVRRMAFCPGGIRQKFHFATFCLWVLLTTLTWRPRWVYASDPLSAPVALMLTWIPGIRVVYHEHDSPGRTQAPSGFVSAVLLCRRLLARRADICIVPNERRLAALGAEAGQLRKPVCVWNCPAVGEAASQPKGEPGIPVWLLYHGSIVPDRLPLTVLDALALLPDSVCLRFAGYETVGARGYIATFLERGRAMGLENRIEFLGTIPQRSDLLRASSASDIGLALMPIDPYDDNCATMTGASNKAFDYMAFGMAMLVSELPDWREMFVDPGYGIACNPEDPRSIAAALRELIGQPDEMRAMGERGRRKVQADWNYETVFRPVFEQMTDREQRASHDVETSRLATHSAGGDSDR